MLSTRRELRHSRRNRKTRYRPARFDNRKVPEGWLAPSVLNRINAHLSVIKRVCSLLPVVKIIVETASFDIQKINNPEISARSAIRLLECPRVCAIQGRSYLPTLQR
ncbi:MAG: RRXRR domain-containing protein [Synergistaceae bacterium]|nr:RRXRR domain-containing protein [Synergistaceae bacterium]